MNQTEKALSEAAQTLIEIRDVLERMYDLLTGARDAALADAGDAGDAEPQSHGKRRG